MRAYQVDGAETVTKYLCEYCDEYADSYSEAVLYKGTNEADSGDIGALGQNYPWFIDVELVDVYELSCGCYTQTPPDTKVFTTWACGECDTAYDPQYNSDPEYEAVECCA